MSKHLYLYFRYFLFIFKTLLNQWKIIDLKTSFVNGS